MNKHKKGSRMLLLSAIAALGMLLGACGAESPTGGTVQTQAAVVTVGTATVGMNACMSCHPATTDAWEKTRHANLNSDPTYTTTAFCAGCHDRTGDSQQLTTPRMVIGCESCHSGGEMHASAGGSGPIGNTTFAPSMIGGVTSSLYVSGQFQTCSTCHQLLLASDPSGTTPATAMHSSTAGSVRVITDTHFAKPVQYSTTGSSAVTSTTTPVITGYAMDYASEKVCINCHNPHGIVNINQEWAQSAHADRTSATGNYFTGAWARYNWSCAVTSASTVTLGCGTSNRLACQRCHTTSGISSYLDALMAGNADYARRIRRGYESLAPYNGTDSWKAEMLECNGCHTDYKGTLRNPGSVTGDYDLFSITTSGTGSALTYTEKNQAFASYAYPDVAGSNVCLACHVGRESGDTLKGLNDPALLSAGTITSTNFSNQSFINSHYLTGGGTVFTATGYEFDGRSYENISTYRHDQIGSSAVPNTGTNGPCIGCHMSRPNGNGDHLFLPVVRSATNVGHIDSVTSEVCIYCHTVSGAGGLEDLMNERKDEIIESLEATAYVLGKRGFNFREAHPYFYRLRLDSMSTGTLGTVSVTNGSATVAGTGTQWVTAPTNTVIFTGTNKDYFKVDDDGTYYQITGATDTTLTLATAYGGVNGTGLRYTIIRSGTSGGVTNWLTQTGSGITPATSTDTDTTGNMTGKNNMGAAFNMNLIEHDPGAYAHNRMYAKRLLYDAIDWADDNILNFSTGTTLNNLSAAAIFKAGAMQYLLPYGVLGIPAERP